MKRKLWLVAIIAIIVVFLSLFAYAYQTYFSNPFNVTWEKNLGNPTYSQEMSPLVENGTFYWLGSYSSNFLPGSNVQLEIQAMNVANGNSEWKNNLTVVNPGFDFYGSSNGQTISSMPHIFWYNGELVLITYAMGFRIGNYAHEMGNTSILVLRFNPGTGALYSYTIYNGTYLSSGFPLVVSGNDLYGSTVQQLGVTYYFNGILTGYFKLDAFGLNLSNSASWNTSLYFQGNPVSEIIPEMRLTGGNLVLEMSGISNEAGYQGNTTFMGFNTSNGRLVWNYTAIGNINGMYSSGNDLYLVNTTNNLTMLNPLNAQTGMPGTPIVLESTPIAFVHNKFLIDHNDTLTAFSLSGEELWASSIKLFNSTNSYTTIMGLSSGYVLSSTIGSHSSYHIVNLSDGKVIWSRSYIPLSSLFSGNGNTETPVLFGENYLICNILTENGDVTVVASNMTSTLSS